MPSRTPLRAARGVTGLHEGSLPVVRYVQRALAWRVEARCYQREAGNAVVNKVMKAIAKALQDQERNLGISSRRASCAASNVYGCAWVPPRHPGRPGIRVYSQARCGGIQVILALAVVLVRLATLQGCLRRCLTLVEAIG